MDEAEIQRVRDEVKELTGYGIGNHAIERMAERGITVNQLAAALREGVKEHKRETDTRPTESLYDWRRKIRVVYHGNTVITAMRAPLGSRPGPDNQIEIGLNIRAERKRRFES